MKLHFDGNQEYQWDAVQAVTRVFEGQPLSGSNFEFTQAFGPIHYTENGFGNRLLLSEEQIWENVQFIQQTNHISTGNTELQGMNFSVEMETGTGKTYVYIRTIYELNKLYGFKKFVVVVPSVAIREGVLKNLQVTNDHFQSLYDRCPVNFNVYDSKNIPQLRDFASANTVQILIINIDSFTKADNIINKTNDQTSGKKPIEFIQSCRPFVIVDEPQNMETSIRKKAIENLHALCTLRYSATHTSLYNLLYSLNPVKAYDLGLVKQIEVDAVLSENAMNDAFMQLAKITIAKTKITARIKIDSNTAAGPVKKILTVKTGDDLYSLSNEREVYKDGFVITEMDAGNAYISFSNGIQLFTGETRGGMNEEIMKYMIRKTIEEHLKKEVIRQEKGIKVLSLFFIDKVSNYREYDDAGNILKGKYARWFEELFVQEIKKPDYKNLYAHLKSANNIEAIIHDGYFSLDNKGRVKDTNGETQADDTMYKLIMQEKEKLLDPDTPLRFIFSHSALREGWDNPNVFQICTLNETKSEIKKRQEIGRGLRLAVNREGERIFDKEINKLTVIANESYEDFAKALQQEIEKDCGVSFTGRIKDKSKAQKINFRKGFEIDRKFLEIWNRIKFQTSYRVTYDTAVLINNAAKKVNEMPETRRPLIKSTKKKLLLTDEGIGGQLLSDSADNNYAPQFDIPDVLSYIQSRTELTRNSIFEILKKSGRINELLINPQLFMDNAIEAIKSALYLLMTDGIRYEKIDGKEYELTLFDDEEMEIYPNSFTFNVANPDKTIYENRVALDSNVEN
ncbi:MAG TPA: DEAD/DEAH box helicase family protein, partial [Chitinophagaceae bacterium]|nr:DEAD/DEAH box helicase family protein [Chitinophagaceae bacterium]